MAHQNDLLYSTSIPPCVLHQCRICGWMVPAEKPKKSMKEKTLRQLLLKDLNKWYSDLFDTDRELYFRIRALLLLRQSKTCGHKEVPTCPCFQDGFTTCDAEQGYNHYEEWQKRVREEIEEIIEPTSLDLKGDALMHYDEGYTDATKDILKLLK